MTNVFHIFAGGRYTLEPRKLSVIRPDSIDVIQTLPTLSEARAYGLALLGPLGHAKWVLIMEAAKDVSWRELSEPVLRLRLNATGCVVEEGVREEDPEILPRYAPGDRLEWSNGQGGQVIAAQLDGHFILQRDADGMQALCWRDPSIPEEEVWCLVNEGQGNDWTDGTQGLPPMKGRG